jgi:hypothetical protein
MADQTLLTEIQRELLELIAQVERVAGRLRAMETIIERYGQDGDGEYGPRRTG